MNTFICYPKCSTCKKALKFLEENNIRFLYQDQYNRSAEFFRLGLRPKVDVTTAEVNLNNEELSLIRAKNLVKTASAQLANAMGVTAPDILNIEEVDDFEKMDIPFDKAIETAYANRPDVLSARTGVQISQIKLNRAKAGFFPTFSFSAGFDQNQLHIVFLTHIQYNLT